MTDNLSKFDLPKGGILMPTFAYRYRVVPSFTSLEEHEAPLFTQQVLNCALDFKNRTIILNVRQSITPDVFNIVHKLVSAQRTILDIDILNGRGDVVYTATFHAECESHKCVFDYAVEGALTHKLEFSYSQMHVKVPTLELTEDMEVDKPKKKKRARQKTSMRG